jgi:hypothetical protein
LLKQIENNNIVFILDDFWLQDFVRTDVIEKFCTYMDNDTNIGFICMVHQNNNTTNYVSKYPELLERGKKVPYRITTQFGIWKRKYLLKVLRKHESAWSFENNGSWRSNFCKERVYVLSPDKPNVCNYHSGGVLFRGKYIKEYIDYIKNESIELSPREIILDAEKQNSPPINKWSIKYIIYTFKSILPKW